MADPFVVGEYLTNHMSVYEIVDAYEHEVRLLDIYTNTSKWLPVKTLQSEGWKRVKPMEEDAERLST